MSKTYQIVTKELMLDSVDHPNMSAGAFQTFAQQEIGKFLKSLPADAEYVAQADLKPLSVNCNYLYVGMTPAALQVTQYQAKAKSMLVHVRADYLEEVKQAVIGEEPAA
jgi:hypothetical protein